MRYIVQNINYVFLDGILDIIRKLENYNFSINVYEDFLDKYATIEDNYTLEFNLENLTLKIMNYLVFVVSEDIVIISEDKLTNDLNELLKSLK